MKNIWIYSLILLIFNQAHVSSFAQLPKVHGADISWCTEMEDDGIKFRDAQGEEKDIFQIMRESGMNAIRLRVWVNPAKYGYGPYCDKIDVIAKAKRANKQGLSIMIDFHYSDFFADPGSQIIPIDWKEYSFEEIQNAIKTHTTDILQALKEEGIEPKWVQVGNETINGMVFPAGQINWNSTGKDIYSNYVTLHNTGYDAVKSIFPKAVVILHPGGADTGRYDGWFFRDFKNAGGKFDMIGLSHYPDYNEWNNTDPESYSNVNTEKIVKNLIQLFQVPVMICETGYSNDNPLRARNVMQDLFDRLTPIDLCAGIFYWEPQVNGIWKPHYYEELGWNAYSMGAFNSDYSPSVTLEPFHGNNTHVNHITKDDEKKTKWYDMQGRIVKLPYQGIYIRKQGSNYSKVILSSQK